jgi:hypothetical protein
MVSSHPKQMQQHTIMLPFQLLRQALERHKHRLVFDRKEDGVKVGRAIVVRRLEWLRESEPCAVERKERTVSETKS